jgi:hypothetical protein
MSAERLQVQTPDGWQWIFCWVTNQGRIATTPDPRNAISNQGDNLEYFSNKTSAEVRAIRPEHAATG